LLGYHDSPRCNFDIWAPQSDTWGHNVIENRAFSPFCLHETENEEIIEALANGDTSVNLNDRTTDDLDYIQQELYRRYSIEVTFAQI